MTEENALLGKCTSDPRDRIASKSHSATKQQHPQSQPLSPLSVDDEHQIVMREIN